MNWQSIETAPKDGTEVLVWYAGGAMLAEWDAEFDGGAWYNGECFLRASEATHWMPLPEPPK